MKQKQLTLTLDRFFSVLFAALTLAPTAARLHGFGLAQEDHVGDQRIDRWALLAIVIFPILFPRQHTSSHRVCGPTPAPRWISGLRVFACLLVGQAIPPEPNGANARR